MSGLSNSAVIFVVVATGIGETLHRQVKGVFELSGVAFRLVTPNGGLLVMLI